MDPNETLRLALTALIEGNRHEACTYLDYLSNWLGEMGFFPDVDSVILSLPHDTTKG